MSAVARESLKNHGLRFTRPRANVFSVFSESSNALSHSDIEKALGKEFDRVTIYRTLTAFLDNGILHKVLDDSGVAKYALCAEECSSYEHHDNHVHFKCTTCGNAECLNETEIPQIKLPSGYRLHASNLLIEGTCKKCIT